VALDTFSIAGWKLSTDGCSPFLKITRVTDFPFRGDQYVTCWADILRARRKLACNTGESSPKPFRQFVCESQGLLAAGSNQGTEQAAAFGSTDKPRST
jgi:hypothetical protein